MGADHKYTMTPTDVPRIETKYRRIVTKLPVPESLPIFEQLAEYEPRSMQGQPPVIWHRAEGVQVFDPWGNAWLDWSSGVLITNAGHAHPAIREAVREMLDRPLLSTYVFPHAARAELCKLLGELAPPGVDKVFLLSTGSEATENAIKLARTYGVQKHGPQKHVIVSFTGAFHGRTLGAQLAGGMPKLKEWIVDVPRSFVQAPFPDGYRQKDTSFDTFLRALDEAGVGPEDVAGVISESYQGVGPNFFPVEYAQALEAWCREHDVALIMDEVQSGFGRTGKFFCFEHYGIVPDIICCGKGISSSLPISAVIGRADIMNLYAPGSMTSTHSGSPLPVASAIANIRILLEERLIEHAAELDPVLAEGLDAIKADYPEHVLASLHRGLVGGLILQKPGSGGEPDPETALAINEACYRRGLLMFAPVGIGGECIKIAPPLTTPRDALEEGLAVLREAFGEVLGGK